MNATKIKHIQPRRIWDSRGRPQVEVDVVLESGICGRGVAPAGASRGSAEAVELRDGGDEFGGYDVTHSIDLIKKEIAPALKGIDVTMQYIVDSTLMMLDGTPDKSRLGGNSLIAVSMACMDAAAKAQEKPLWQYLIGEKTPQLPLPEIQILAGGAHAGHQIDIQDFMVMAVGADDFETALNWTAEVYRAAGQILADRGKLSGVGDEGGFWPAFDSNEAAITLLLEAIEKAGRRPGEEIAIALDIAATQFFKQGKYILTRDQQQLDSEEFIALLTTWTNKYPIFSLEDPLAEDDHQGMQQITASLGSRIQIVGDDYLATNGKKIITAVKAAACNCALIKPNQAGTLTEAVTALEMARHNNFGTIVSARSGESEDTMIMHLAVGWRAKQIKVGALARSERTAKWNEGLRMAEQFNGALPARTEFPWA